MTKKGERNNSAIGSSSRFLMDLAWAHFFSNGLKIWRIGWKVKRYALASSKGVHPVLALMNCGMIHDNDTVVGECWHKVVDDPSVKSLCIDCGLK
jgi:hypothetical protein